MNTYGVFSVGAMYSFARSECRGVFALCGFLKGELQVNFWQSRVSGSGYMLATCTWGWRGRNQWWM